MPARSRRRDHLSRGLSVGSAARQGGVPQGGQSPRRRPQRGADPVGCVLRRPLSGEFLDLIKTGTVDLVFANESELKALYETADFDTGVKALRGRRAARGGDTEREGLRRRDQGRHGRGAGGTDRAAGRHHRRRRPVRGGLPVRVARGRDHQTAARLGALAAAEVIQHIGARPEVSLKELARRAACRCSKQNLLVIAGLVRPSTAAAAGKN